jgi:hypothetical protein
VAANTALGHTAQPVAGRFSAGVQITWFCIKTASVIEALESAPNGGYFALMYPTQDCT